MSTPNFGNTEAVDALFTKGARTPENEGIISRCYLWSAAYAAAFLPDDLTGTPFAGMEHAVKQVRNVVRMNPTLNMSLARLGGFV